MKLEDLKQDGYFYEYKETSPFWKTRLSKLNPDEGGNLEANTEIVFLIGSEPHRFKIENIFLTAGIPEKYKEAITTYIIDESGAKFKWAYAIKCTELK